MLPAHLPQTGPFWPVPKATQTASLEAWRQAGALVVQAIELLEESPPPKGAGALEYHQYVQAHATWLHSLEAIRDRMADVIQRCS